MSRQVVVTTAGHVDHGKSTLIRCLTGQQTDRLEAEQRRGMTIALGFTHRRDLDGGPTLAFCDVPGHRRFVPTMVAGASASRLALLVVAADDGWMAQTEEHSRILWMLGVAPPVVALTKIDRVEPNMISTRSQEVIEHLTQIGWAEAELRIVPVSGHTREGVDRLAGALHTAAQGIAKLETTERPRLWVDRSFTLEGVGTVVTGTLIGAALSPGELVSVSDGPTCRVRAIHTFGSSLERAEPGTRVGLQLSGVKPPDVPPGTHLGRPGQWRRSDRVIVHSPGWREHRRGVTVHLGTATRPATAVPICDDMVHLHLIEPVVVSIADRLIIRDPGASRHDALLGGGVVLDPVAGPPVRGREARTRHGGVLAQAVRTLGDGESEARRVAALLTQHPVLAANALPALSNRPEGSVPFAVQRGDLVFHPSWWELQRGSVLRQVAEPLREDPELAGVSPSTLFLDPVDNNDRYAVGSVSGVDTPALLERVINDLVQDGKMVRGQTGLSLPGRRVTPSWATTKRIRERVRSGVTPVPIEHLGLNDDQLAAAVAGGLIHVIGPVGAISAEQLGNVITVVHQLADRGPFTVAQLRDALGSSRRVVVPLLEYLDSQGVTRREGSLRTVGGDLL